MIVPRIEQGINERTNRVVFTSVSSAAGVVRSFKGLMFDKALPPGHGLRFTPARGIDTQYMRFPIDLIFLDESDRVSKIREAMAPWRFDVTTAASVIEANGHAAREHDIQVGDRLRFEPIDAETTA